MPYHFCRFVHRGQQKYGVLLDGTIVEAEAVSPTEYRPSDRAVDPAEIEWLPPVTPSKIVAVGANYHSHAEEMGRPLPPEPMLFLKPSTATIGHEGEIVYPAQSERVDFEGELAVVVGRHAHNVSLGDAPQHVLGYTVLNDVTARDLQARDIQFTRAKSFDTFCPLGPYLVTELDPGDLRITTRLNGRVMQQGTTADLEHGVYELVSYISQVMTLLPGDVIATGTPRGVGPMQIGDTVEVEIDGIGLLRNRVVAGSTADEED